jgi:hypothetical protein
VEREVFVPRVALLFANRKFDIANSFLKLVANPPPCNVPMQEEEKMVVKVNVNVKITIMRGAL